jgi:hypothetical protein
MDGKFDQLLETGFQKTAVSEIEELERPPAKTAPPLYEATAPSVCGLGKGVLAVHAFVLGSYRYTLVVSVGTTITVFPPAP